jgi:hypothetical protein
MISKSSNSTFYITILIVILLTIPLGYGGFKLQRWWHYKFSYQSKVLEEIQPLVLRIEQLERDVVELKRNDIIQ